MSLPVPNLDDRRFQDIVDECRRRIPTYTPEWTDHNLSDPGITLVELFAWMSEQILYRLNKVPDKNYIKFLELIGVRLLPGSAAKVDVTFGLSGRQVHPVVIPKGTEVATVRTETQEAIVFTTDEDLPLGVPTPDYFLVTTDDTEYLSYSRLLRDPGRKVDIFESVPRPGNAFYVGFDEDISSNTLVLVLESTIEGIGVDPRNPPIAWEYWDVYLGRWMSMEVEEDGTGGLNRRGEVTLHVPRSCGPCTVDLQRAWWVRCRATAAAQGQPAYSTSPKIHAIEAYCAGGTVPATNAVVVREEILGTSDGAPGQIFRLRSAPVLPRLPGEIVEVEGEDGAWERWEEVDDFADSKPQDRHFICSSATGEVIFGPSIRQPTGEECQFGAIPERGPRIRFRAYRYGGGAKGNVGRSTITVLKSSIPYVAKVVNRTGAAGGADPEVIDNAKLRGTRLLRSRDRAVTVEDFEYLSVEASQGVARARCIQPLSRGDAPPPGVVTILIVPSLPPDMLRPAPDQLERLPAALVRDVQAYLDERRLLTTKVILTTPTYRWVAIEVEATVSRRADPEAVARETEEQLYRFLHPLLGGLDGTGWPFGRSLLIPEVYSRIQTIAPIEYIRTVKLSIVDPRTGERSQPVQKVDVPPDGLIASREHRVVLSTQR